MNAIKEYTDTGTLSSKTYNYLKENLSQTTLQVAQWGLEMVMSDPSIDVESVAGIVMVYTLERIETTSPWLYAGNLEEESNYDYYFDMIYKSNLANLIILILTNESFSLSSELIFFNGIHY